MPLISGTKLGPLRNSIPDRLEEVIHKALEKDRELRYQPAAEIRADLKRIKRDTEFLGIIVVKSV